MKNKRIITAALTGSIHVPSLSPHLPITPGQIIEEGIAAAEAGAAILHIHARNPETGEPSTDLGLYCMIAAGIQAHSDAIIEITTGGKLGSTVEERLAIIPALKPELASCNGGSNNFFIGPLADKIGQPKYDWELPYIEQTSDVILTNTFRSMETYIHIMQANGTKPEFEVFDVGMLSNIDYFLKKGILKGPVYLQFVLGIRGGMPADMDNLLFLYNSARKIFGDGFLWSCAAAGKSQMELVTAAMTMGGMARVGLEDNLYISKGKLAKSNAEPVAKIRRIAEELGYEVATPAEAREMLRLPANPAAFDAKGDIA